MKPPHPCLWGRIVRRDYKLHGRRARHVNGITLVVYKRWDRGLIAQIKDQGATSTVCIGDADRQSKRTRWRSAQENWLPSSANVEKLNELAAVVKKDSSYAVTENASSLVSRSKLRIIHAETVDLS